MPTGPKPPIPVGVAKIIHEGTLFLKNWANIYYHLITGTSGTVNVADIISLAHQAHTNYGTTVQGLKADASTLHTTKAIYVPSLGTELVGEYSSDVSGIQHFPPMPNNVAIVASWLTDQYYRGGHARTYFDAPPEGDAADGVSWSPAAITAWENEAAALLAANNNITTTHIILTAMGTVNFARHNAWLSPAVWTPYFGVTVHPRIDTQRRRLGKETV